MWSRRILLLPLLLAGLLLSPALGASAATGDAQAFMNALPSGGHSKTCSKPATARVNSAAGGEFTAKFVNQKYNAKKHVWQTMRGYTQTFRAKTNNWIKFSSVVFGGCGFGKGKYRLALHTAAFYMTYENGFAQKHVVGRDSVSRSYWVT